jgi:hypothetical protein
MCTGYEYAGQSTVPANGDYKGIEGYISEPSISLTESDTESHVINWVGAISPGSNACDMFTQCWVQAGNGIGTVSGDGKSATAASLAPYFEEADEYGYDPWFGSWSYSSNALISIYFNGMTRAVGSLTYGEYSAFITPSGGSPIPVGSAWLNDYGHSWAESTTEVEQTVTNYCPVLDEYEYFGTSGSGGGGSAYYMELYSHAGSWEAWPTSDYLNISSADEYYGYSQINAEGAFETWKVGA